MSLENAKKLHDILSSNKNIHDELKELLGNSSNEELEAKFEAFSKKNETECTLAEFLKLIESELRELSPEDLDNIDAGSPTSWLTRDMLNYLLKLKEGSK